MLTIYQIRYANVRDLVERMGGGTAFAVKTGMSKQLVSNISRENPSKTIGSRLARKIEAELGLPAGKLDTPEGMQVVQHSPEDESVPVPVLNIIASAGPGAVMPWGEEVIHHMRLSKHWLRNNTRATSFDRLAIITAKGDSMVPTFDDGSVLLVDTAITNMKIEGIYTIARGDDLYIKRVQRNLDGSYDVISDNKAYSQQRIEDPHKEGFMVLGRVMVAWNPRKL